MTSNQKHTDKKSKTWSTMSFLVLVIMNLILGIHLYTNKKQSTIGPIAFESPQQSNNSYMIAQNIDPNTRVLGVKTHQNELKHNQIVNLIIELPKKFYNTICQNKDLKKEFSKSFIEKYCD